jgi:rRNA maturation protein Nop10
MSRARRLKRVFAIDIETCPHCGEKLRVIASIEEPALIA